MAQLFDPKGVGDYGRRALQRMKEYVDSKFVLAGPVGELVPFAGVAAPTGFMVCNGQAISRTTYSGLFVVIGTVWGVGDGSTTFNLPDLRGRTLIGAGTGVGLSARSLAGAGGAETHLLTAAESGLPSHNHTQNAHNHTQNAHNHGDVVMPGTGGGNTDRIWGDFNAAPGGLTGAYLSPSPGWTAFASAAFTQNATATNQAATATNNAVTAANAAAAHNNMQPFAVVNWVIRVS
jgi:microcystin-dependent protein